jgi:hypothetical protein
MFDRTPIERLGFHVHAAIVQDMERIARAVANRQHDVVAGRNSPLLRCRPLKAGAVGGGLDLEILDAGLEAVFAAQRLDRFADALDHGDQPERADMRVRLVRISSGAPALTNSVSTLRPKWRGSLIWL